MSQKRAGPPKALPGWLIGLASLLIGVHLCAIAVRALAAPSGPWPTPFGSSVAFAPEFAGRTNRVAGPYLSALHLTHTYHFASNQPSSPAIYFEARLKDDQGQVVKTLKFPDDGDNFWLRYRETLLAQGLGNDQPYQRPPGTELLPAAGQKMPTVTIWDATQGDPTLKLKEMPEHLVPRDRPVFRPTEWSLVLARSYARHLCREYHAAAVELLRHSRNPIMPETLLLNEPPPGTFNELISTYGEYRP